MTIRSLETQCWYWGKEDKEDANRALEHCLDGTYLVRQSSTPPDQTIHVVCKGIVKLIKILVRGEVVGLSPESMCFNSVVDLIEYYSHASLPINNKDLNVRLTNPLTRNTRDDNFDDFLTTEPTLVVYVQLYMESEISIRKGEKYTKDLVVAEEEAHRLAYRATSQHKVVEMWKEQLKLRSIALNHFSSEYQDYVKRNFDVDQSRRLKEAEEELEETMHQVTIIQGKVRQLVLMREEIERRERRLYRKMDWYERMLRVELGFDNDTVSNCIAPFRQDLGTKILMQGIKEMWFVGEMNSLDATKLLEGKGNSGTFLVRLNSDHTYVISVINQGTIRHIRIQEDNDEHLFWLKTPLMFHSVELLVKHFQNNSLGQQDSEYDIMLMHPVYLPSE